MSLNEYVSKTYDKWYQELFSDFSIAVPQGKISKHPHFFLRKESKKFITNKRFSLRHLKEFDGAFRERSVYTNSKKFLRLFQKNFFINSNFDYCFEQLPPLTNGGLYLGTGTNPKFLFIAKKAYVVVLLKNPDKYLQTYRLLSKVIRGCNPRVSTLKSVAFIKTYKNVYFLSEFVGQDFEIEILERGKDELLKELLTISKELDTHFLSKGYFVRNIAPRNIINGRDGKIYVIDYDNLYKIEKKNALEIHKKFLARSVWYADLLSEAQIRRLFSKINLSHWLPKTIVAENFEYLFFGKKRITLREREFLYMLTKRFEKKDLYQGNLILGHQLGRFISDFWSERSEVSLLKIISKNNRVRSIRAELFWLSKIDQQLLLYQEYGYLKDLNMVSERYFNMVTRVVKSKNIGKVKQIYFSSENLSKKISQINQLIS